MTGDGICHPLCEGVCSECTPAVHQQCEQCCEPMDPDDGISLVDGYAVHTETCAAEYAAEAAARNYDPEGLGLWNPDAKRWRRLGPEVTAEWTESTIERATGDVWVWVK